MAEDFAAELEKEIAQQKQEAATTRVIPSRPQPPPRQIAFIQKAPQ